MTKKDEQQLRQNPVNEFTCCGKTMLFGQLKEHLGDVHNCDPSQMKGKKTMMAHIDGDKWYSSTYKWELENGIMFTQYTMMARGPKNSYYY